MILKWLGIVLALSLLVAFALVPSSLLGGRSSEREFDQDLHQSIQNSLDVTLALQAQVAELQEDIDWAIWHVDSLYDFITKASEEVVWLQQEVGEEREAQLASQSGILLPIQEHLNALEALIQEFEEQDGLPELTSSAYSGTQDISHELIALTKKLQAISDDLAQTPGAQEGGADE